VLRKQRTIAKKGKNPMDMQFEILQILSRYHSLERKTLLQLTLAGKYSTAAEQAFDQDLGALKESGRAIAPSGLHGRWMLAPPATSLAEQHPETPRADSRRGSRRA
jgi:hypothetical protein